MCPVFSCVLRLQPLLSPGPLMNGKLFSESEVFCVRKKAVKSVDKEVFRRTASHTKAVNLGLIRYRGGIRF